MKRHQRWWIPVIAGTVVVAGVVVGANLFQPKADQTPNIVQNTMAPLTVKQVFASAQLAAAKNSQPQADQVLYQRVVNYMYSGYCEPYIEIEEFYTDANGVKVKDVRKNLDGKIIESAKFDANGALEGEPYFDQSALDPVMAQSTHGDQCAHNTGTISEADQAAYAQHVATIAAAYGLPAETKSADGDIKATMPPYWDDLHSGNAKKQAEVFKKLENLNEWTVKQNVSVPQYFKQKVIVLSFTAGPFVSEKLYFSQNTKAYLGTSWIDPSSATTQEQAAIVVEQGVRPASEAK